MENSNRKGNTVLLTVIAIATLLVAIVGATFAYFTASVKTDGSSSIIIKAATIGEIEFTDGKEISLLNALPGTEDTKTFTIKASGDMTNESGITYAISLNIEENTFQKIGEESDLSDLVYSLKGTVQSSSGGSVVTPADNNTLNAVSNKVSIGTGVIKSGETHSYTFTIRFREMGSDQNSNQGASFKAAIQVTTSDSEGDLYYTSANPSGTKDAPEADSGISTEGE